MTRPLPNSFLPLLAGGLAALVALVACQPPGAQPATAAGEHSEPPPLVRVEPVQLRAVQRMIETTSYLESEHRVRVVSKVAGRVLEVMTDEGQAVQPGEVLARLDDRQAKAAVRQVEAKIADGEVRRDLLKLTAETQDRRIQQARLERDQAKAQHDRNLQYEQGLIPQKEIDDSHYSLEVAEEAVLVAQLDKRKAELEALAVQNSIDDLKAQLEIENIKLADHQIVAPIAGVIADRMIRGGETISTTSDLFEVVDSANLVAYLRRPQRELRLIRDARQVSFITDALPDVEFTADIDMISPVIDSETGSFRIRIRVRDGYDQAELLRPGMFIRAKILTEEQRETLMVSKAAIVNEGAQSVVFVVRDGVARRVVLHPGIEERDHVESLDRGTDGLQPGDRVVISGQQSLRDQTAVEVAENP